MNQNTDSHSAENRRVLPLFLLLIGCAFLFCAGLQVRHKQQFSENFRHVTGRVERLYTEKRGGPESSRPDEVKKVAYSFDAEKRSYQSTGILTDKEWGSLTVGGTLSIVYLPNDPRFSAIDRPFLWEGLDWIAGVVAFMGFGVLALALILFLRRPRLVSKQTSLDRISPPAKIY